MLISGKGSFSTDGQSGENGGLKEEKPKKVHIVTPTSLEEKLKKLQLSSEAAAKDPGSPKEAPSSPSGSTSPNSSFIRNKYSSTSSLFISDTISQPDVEVVLRCMAKRLLEFIKVGASDCQKIYFDMFNEMIHPITKSNVNFYKLPSEDAVFGFIKFIYVYERMEPECIIMCLAYIERLIEYTGVTVDTSNWRRIALASWIVALKAWEELAVYNLDFLGCFDGKVTVRDLNLLEMHFLNLIQYNVYLKASDYAKYYFELKSYTKVEESQFPLMPLSKEKASLLEKRSSSSQNMAKLAVRKSISLDMLKPITCFVPAVIS